MTDAFSSAHGTYLHTGMLVVVSFANFQQFTLLDLFEMIQRLGLGEAF